MTMSGASSTGESAPSLQARLHGLLSNLYHTTELVKKWPESDDTSTHVETTTKLIDSLQEVVGSLREVEDKVMAKGGTADPGDKKLSDELRKVQVPLDLLELLDYGGGINPDTYARALLREADRQIKKLNRRKLVLGLLAFEIDKGIKKWDKEEAREQDAHRGSKLISAGAVKRKREDGDAGSPDEPLSKKKS